MTFPIAIALIVTLDAALIALLAFVMALPRHLGRHRDRAAAQVLNLRPRAAGEAGHSERYPLAA